MKTLKHIFLGLLITFSLSSSLKADGCMDKLFSVTIDSSMTIGDALDNLAETCGLTVVVKDSGAKHKLGKKLYYVKLKNATLKSFLDTLLKDNDLNYTLKGNKLTISYLITRTFKIHYVAGDRSGESKANVTIAGDSGTATNNNTTSQKGSSITITTNQKFQFWNTIKDEIHKILNTAGDGSIHFTKVGNEWIGPDGQKWEYNPLEPVVNPEAGLVTVTGTARQIQRVSRYIATLTKQIKTEVMIDVQILDVRMTNAKTTGIDWSKIYNTNIGLQGTMTGGPAAGTKGSSFTATISGDLTGFIKFLRAQGDLIAVSSPKVMTLNNQPAMISVGKEIFYTTTSVTSANNGGNQNFENQEINSVFAGILLDITPEVDERGMVTLKINPSISKEAVEVTETTNTNTVRTMPPDLIRRQMASVIKVRDGDHAILGGLITRSKEKINGGVPLLSDIPIIGQAFKRSEYTDIVDELVIIITPHIVRNGTRGVTLKDLGYRNVK